MPDFENVDNMQEKVDSCIHDLEVLLKKALKENDRKTCKACITRLRALGKTVSTYYLISLVTEEEKD